MYIDFVNRVLDDINPCVESEGNGLKRKLTGWVGWLRFRTDQDGSESGVLTMGDSLEFAYALAEDWRSWECLAFEVNLPSGGQLELEAEVIPLEVGRPEYVEKVKASVVIAGEGWKSVEIPFSAFDYDHAAGALWRFIHKVSIRHRTIPGDAGFDLALRNVCLKHRGTIHLCANRLSQSANPGDVVYHEFTVSNGTDEVQAVSLALERSGWQAMRAEIDHPRLILGPSESRPCMLRVHIHDLVAPGGWEMHKVTAVPNGDGSRVAELALITVRALPHPYILHTESGWDEVLRKVENFDWARGLADDHVRVAEAWVVPDVHGKEYTFDLNVRFPFLSTAIAWKLTGARSSWKSAPC